MVIWTNKTSQSELEGVMDFSDTLPTTSPIDDTPLGTQNTGATLTAYAPVDNYPTYKKMVASYTWFHDQWVTDWYGV